MKRAYVWLRLSLPIVIAVITISSFVMVRIGCLPDPNEMHMSERYLPPSSQHLLGTDSYGRDVLARVFAGSQTTVSIGLASTALALVIGGGIGLVAGYTEGTIDILVMRVVDGLMAFPGIVMALALVAVLGSSGINVILALGIMSIPTFARVTRAGVMRLKHEAYIEAARASGATGRRILLIHIVPGLARSIWAQIGYSFAAVILSEAALSYLGLGVPPPEPSWGRMLKEAQTAIDIAPWTAMGPGLALALTILGSFLLAETLGDAADNRQPQSL